MSILLQLSLIFAIGLIVILYFIYKYNCNKVSIQPKSISQNLYSQISFPSLLSKNENIYIQRSPIIKMEKETNKPKKGSWDNLPTTDIERKPKIEFDVNITQKVVFISEPKEYTSQIDSESVFYVFDVEQDKQAKVIMTSAWTLLHELKKLSPLTGKVVEITKKMNKGKQFFEVKELKQDKKSSVCKMV